MKRSALKFFRLFINPKTLMIALVFAGVAAMAEGHGGKDPSGLNEHELKTIIYQCINFALLIVGLVYFLRKPTKEFFQKRRSLFTASAEKALALKQAAEKERAEIQRRLAQLESSANDSRAKAHAEAAEMKKGLIIEAEALSKRIQQDAATAAQQETQKAKAELRAQMISDASKIAFDQLSKLSPEDQKRMQTDFVDQIQNIGMVKS